MGRMEIRSQKFEYGHWDGYALDQISKEELYRRVYHDVITGYYNWNYMWHKLDRRTRPSNLKYCFVHFDIKGTKIINSTYGHNAVNELLCSICAQIEKEKEEGWVIEGCRCDNDNFSMMIKVMPEDEIVKKLTNMFNSVSILPCDFKYRVFYRCGVVTAEDANASDDRVADFAKFAQRFGNTFHQHDINFYTSEMYRNLNKGNEYLSHLDAALMNDEFEAWFQPKYDINSEKIVGAEALVRWNYKHEKLVFPAEFIPLFERSFVVYKLDKVMLKKTCETLAKFKEMGLPLFTVSVNLSRSCLVNENLLVEICQTVDKYKIPHDKIEFELTESATYKDVEAMFMLLRNLRELDFKVSMDDFGTGYSSLSLLKDMPMDTLKIDKSFVDAIIVSDYDARENVVVKGIISMANQLGFTCLAEGAEHKEQVDFLRKAGCDKIQGYYYSKPVPADTYLEMIRNQK